MSGKPDFLQFGVPSGSLWTTWKWRVQSEPYMKVKGPEFTYYLLGLKIIFFNAASANVSAVMALSADGIAMDDGPGGMRSLMPK